MPLQGGNAVPECDTARNSSVARIVAAEGDLSRFRGHVGHTYTAEMMSFALDEDLRRALASALREERTALARKLYHQAKDSGHRLLAQTWAGKMEEFERETDIIRDSTRRMDRLAAQADMAKQSAAE